MLTRFIKQWQTLSRRRWAIAVALVALAGAGVYGFTKIDGTKAGHSEVSSQSRKGLQRYTPSAAEWASLTIQPVAERGFRAEHVTEGKIAIDEDRSTPVFSPYAGRVTRLLAKPGDRVVKGQPLFVIEAADNVQAQNDFIAAMAAMNKAKSALDRGAPVRIEEEIHNTDRSAGAMLSGTVAKIYGHAGLPLDTIHVSFKGTAGQAFGAWLAQGVTFELEGEGNDYVGKGLSGGRIVVKPPRNSGIVPERASSSATP